MKRIPAMWSKLSALSLVFAMTLSLLTGCGSGGGSSSSAPSASSSGSTSAAVSASTDDTSGLPDLSTDT